MLLETLLFALLPLLLAPAMLLCEKKNSEKTDKSAKRSGEEPQPSKMSSKTKSVTKSLQVSRNGSSGGSAHSSVPSSSQTKSPKVASQQKQPEAPPPAIIAPRQVNSNVPKTLSPGSRVAPLGQGTADDGGYDNMPEMTPEELDAAERNMAR